MEINKQFDQSKSRMIKNNSTKTLNTDGRWNDLYSLVNKFNKG